MSRILNKKTPVQHITIGTDDDDRRVDNFLLARLKGVPRTRIYQMLRRGEVRANKGRIKQTYRLQEGDILRIPPLMEESEVKKAEAPEHLLARLKSSILYEDEHLIAVNKPSGLVVHSGTGRSFGVIELLRHLRPKDSNLQLVHRLDQETSGCLLISKTASGLRQLHNALKAGEVKKHYISLLMGDIGSQKRKVESRLKKNILESGERRVKVDKEGKNAVSIFRRIKRFRSTCLAEVKIETGRTHQIRVQALQIGHPVCGDAKYGEKNDVRELRKMGLKRLFLHASGFSLPAYGSEGLYIRASLSEDLENFLKNHV